MMVVNHQLSGSPSKCIFTGRFKNKTGDTVAAFGCMGSETVINIGHDGRVTKLTLRDRATLRRVAPPQGTAQNATRAARVKRQTGKFTEVDACKLLIN